MQFFAKKQNEKPNSTAANAQQTPATKKVKAFFREIMQKPAVASGEPTTLNNKSFLDRYMYLVYVMLAFFIPFLLMFIAYRMAGVSEEGKKMMMVTDLWHQYYPFLVDYQAKLHGGESLLWSWTSGGGTNYLGLIAYYLASPLNFLTVLFPAGELKEFVFLAVCVKIGFAGMFFSLFLKIAFKRKDLSITAFGVMYGLCSFIMGYYWNIIWLDTIALMPLVAAGAICLLRDRKFKLYIISLALAILANYYIGLFVCFGVLILSIGYTIIEFKGLKNVIKNFFWMAGSSLVSLMLTAFLTVPAYLALGHTYSASNTFPKAFEVNYEGTPDFAGVLKGILLTISNSVDFVAPTAKSKTGLPNIATGMVILFLAILFFFCSKIKKRERIFCGFVLLFLLTSFIIKQLDYIWHGFHFPNELPNRFAFIYSFVLIYMAFRVFMYIDYVKFGSVLGAIGAFAVYLYLASIYADDKRVMASNLIAAPENGYAKTSPLILSACIGGIIAAWVLLYSLREKLPRLHLSLLSAAIGVASLVLVLSIYDLLDKSKLTPETQNQTVAENGSTAFPTVVTVLFIFIIIAIAALLLSRYNTGNRMLKAILPCVLVIMVIFEGMESTLTSSVRSNDNDVPHAVTSVGNYPMGEDATLAVTARIKELEKNEVDISRADVVRYHTLNDCALIGVNGYSMFSSMTNMRITYFTEQFGLCSWLESNRYVYQQSSPFTNLMLNIKYLVGTDINAKQIDKIYTEKVPDADIYGENGGHAALMKSKYYLPMGFMVNDDLLRYQQYDPVAFINRITHTDFVADYFAAGSNPIDNQNEFFRLATGIDGDLYEYIPFREGSSSSGGTVTETASGSYQYTSDQSNDTFSITFTPERKGVVLCYITTSNINNEISFSMEGETGKRITHNCVRPFLAMVGSVDEVDENNPGNIQDVTATVTVNNGSSSGTITCHMVMLNDDLFMRAYRQFSRSTLRATTVSATEIEGDINAVEDGLFYTSIPYVTGWRAFVDGEEVEITPVGGAMLAFRLGKGAHTIRLTYMPEGFVVGLIVSGLGLIIFILMIILWWKRAAIAALWRRTKLAAFTARVGAKLPRLPKRRTAAAKVAVGDNGGEGSPDGNDRKPDDDAPAEKNE